LSAFSALVLAGSTLVLGAPAVQADTLHACAFVFNNNQVKVTLSNISCTINGPAVRAWISNTSGTTYYGAWKSIGGSVATKEYGVYSGGGAQYLAA
jgi:hypothetical protein